MVKTLKNKDLKITVFYNNKVIIENYNNLIDINETLIIIDNYKIKGTNLQIKEINDYLIIIIGIINNIEIVNDNKWNIM